MFFLRRAACDRDLGGPTSSAGVRSTKNDNAVTGGDGASSRRRSASHEVMLASWAVGKGVSRTPARSEQPGKTSDKGEGKIVRPAVRTKRCTGRVSASVVTAGALLRQARQRPG